MKSTCLWLAHKLKEIMACVIVVFLGQYRHHLVPKYGRISSKITVAFQSGLIEYYCMTIGSVSYACCMMTLQGDITVVMSGEE